MPTQAYSAEYNRRYYAANHEAIRQQQREYRAANRERLNQQRREGHAANREHENQWHRDHCHDAIVVQRRRDYRVANREAIRQRQREIHRELKIEVLTAYGSKCVCCGETQPDFLTIDHVNGDGKTHRKQVGRGHVYRDLKRRGFPKEGFRVLCQNCNYSIWYYGYCRPHKER